MKKIINRAKVHGQRLFAENLPKEYVYHNFAKTEEILAEAMEIGESIMLSEEEMELLALSVLFSFTGYTMSADDPYSESSKIAKEFLLSQDYPADKITQIQDTILFLKNSENPKSRIKEAFLDAHNFQYGKKSFFKRNGMLKLEEEFIGGNSIDDKQWYKKTLMQMEKHEFYTLFAKKKYDNKKNNNIKKLNKIIADIGNIHDKKKITFNPFGRSVETMFRNNLRGHLELSTLADNKANIMLSINAIILSIILTVMLPNIMTYIEFLIPTILLIITCITSIVYATLATRPQITSGTFTRDDIKKKKTNLLFFGNFFNMPLDEFQWGMSEMIKDRDYLYGSMIKDFYFLGLVLNKKFSYLRICYNVFMFGFIISIIAYFITFLFIDH